MNLLEMTQAQLKSHFNSVRQSGFGSGVPFSSMKRPTRQSYRKGCKVHRVIHFFKSWYQFGYESQADHDLDRWGIESCKAIASQDGHPKQTRARDAVRLAESRSN